MSHELYKNDWMFSAVTPAWHGIGTVTEDALNAADAIRIAKLDWGVNQEEIFRFQRLDDIPPNAVEHIQALNELGIAVNPGRMRALKNWFANVRGDLSFEDPASDLGCVRGSYGVISNVACFDLIDRVVGKLGAKYETAGSLKSGKRIFLLARCPQDMKVADDVVRPYLLLSTSHDGSTALEVKFTTVRVVCWNTMSVALADNSVVTMRVKHTSGAVDAQGNVRRIVVDEVRNEIGQKAVDKASELNADDSGQLISSAMEYISRQQRIFSELAQKQVTTDFVRDYFDVLIPSPVKGSETRTDNKRGELRRIYFGTQPGDEMEAMRLDRQTGTGTAWRLYNAVTHYNDHVATNKRTIDKSTGEKKSFAEARFSRVLASSGFRDDALNILTEGVDSNGESLREAKAKLSEMREEALQRALARN